MCGSRELKSLSIQFAELQRLDFLRQSHFPVLLRTRVRLSRTASFQVALTTPLVSAIVLMGDPTFVVGQPFDKGNATRGGVSPFHPLISREKQLMSTSEQMFARRNVSSTCAAVLSKMVSYCDSGDTFCDSAGNTPQGIQIHIGYVQEYGKNATEFVLSKLKTPAMVPVSIGTPANGLRSIALAGFLCIILSGTFTMV